MNFGDFIKKGQVRKCSKDELLVKSILNTVKNDLKFLKSLKIDKYSARKIMSNYYDVLRSLLEAIAILDEYKIYSHEAFTYFLKEKKEDLISEKFDRFRKIRNKINYYGEDITVEEVKVYVVEITNLIEILKEKYLEK